MMTEEVPIVIPTLIERILKVNIYNLRKIASISNFKRIVITFCIHCKQYGNEYIYEGKDVIISVLMYY